MVLAKPQLSEMIAEQNGFARNKSMKIRVLLVPPRFVR